MLERLTNDEVSDVLAIFEGAGRNIFEAYRMYQMIKSPSPMQTVSNDTMRDYLKGIVNNNPFIFTGEVTDLSWFWNGKQDMPYSTFKDLDPDLRKAIAENFNHLSQQGYVLVDNEKQNIILTDKGKEMIYSDNFVGIGLKKHMEVNENITSGLGAEVEKRTEQQVDKEFDKLSQNLGNRQQELLQKLNLQLNKDIEHLKANITQDNANVVVSEFLNSIQSLKAKSLLNMEQSGFSPSKEIIAFRKSLDKFEADVMVHNKPIATAIEDFKTFSQSPHETVKSPHETVKSPHETVKSSHKTVKSPHITVKSHRDMFFEAVEKCKAEKVDLYIHNTGKDEYIKLSYTNKAIEYEAVLNGKVVETTVGYFDIAKDYKQDDIRARYKKFENPVVSNEKALTSINIGKESVQATTQVSNEVVKETSKQIAKEVGKQSANAVVTTTTGVATGGVSTAVQVGYEVLNSGIKFVSEQTRK